MPIYIFRCDSCGSFEMRKARPTGGVKAICPECGKTAHRDWQQENAGLRPFSSYWTEALSTDVNRPVYVDSREKERKLCARFGFERVK